MDSENPTNASNAQNTKYLFVTLVVFALRE